MMMLLAPMPEPKMAYCQNGRAAPDGGTKPLGSSFSAPLTLVFVVPARISIVKSSSCVLLRGRPSASRTAVPNAFIACVSLFWDRAAEDMQISASATKVNRRQAAGGELRWIFIWGWE